MSRELPIAARQRRVKLIRHLPGHDNEVRTGALQELRHLVWLQSGVVAAVEAAIEEKSAHAAPKSPDQTRRVEIIGGEIHFRMEIRLRFLKQRRGRKEGRNQRKRD